MPLSIHQFIYPSIHPETAFLTQLSPFYTILHTLDFKINFLYFYCLNYHLFAENLYSLAIISLLRLNSKSPLLLGICIYVSVSYRHQKLMAKQNLAWPQKFCFLPMKFNTVKGITLYMVTSARKSSTAHEISTLSSIYSPVSNCRMRTPCHSGQCFDIFAPSLLCPPPPSCCQVLFASGRGCG